MTTRRRSRRIYRGTLEYARLRADQVAKAISSKCYYHTVPMLRELRLRELELVYSQIGVVTNFHVPATNPREESVGFEWGVGR